jgi:putative PIN family toxin of toxin-antitoxin system
MPEVAAVKAVYDTNVIVSAAISEEGIPWWTLQLALSGEVHLFVSPPLLEEYRRVIAKPHLRAYPNIQQTFETLERRAELIIPAFTLNMTLDPSDNRVVECAVEAKAYYIVTGNKRHFPFSTYEGIKVVSPREFLEEIAPDILLLI